MCVKLTILLAFALCVQVSHTFSSGDTGGDDEDYDIPRVVIYKEDVQEPKASGDVFKDGNKTDDGVKKVLFFNFHFPM